MATRRNVTFTMPETERMASAGQVEVRCAGLWGDQLGPKPIGMRYRAPKGEAE